MNILLLVLLPKLPLVLLLVLYVLLLGLPPRILTSVGITATMETRLNAVIPLALGFQETSWPEEGSHSSCWRL